MKTKVTSRSAKSSVIIAIVGVIIVIALTLLVLEKLNITKFYTKEPTQDTIQASDSSSQKSTKIDLSPAKQEDSVVVPDKSINNNTNPEPNTNNQLSVIITSSRTSGSRYLIKAVISGSDNASCKATLTSGTTILEAYSSATLIAGQYSCSDLYIPTSSITKSGEWDLTVTVTDKTGATASTSQRVII